MSKDEDYEEKTRGDRWRKEKLDSFVHFPWKVSDKTDEAEFVMEDHVPQLLLLDLLLYPTSPTSQYDKRLHAGRTLKSTTYKNMASLLAAPAAGLLSIMAHVLDTTKIVDKELQD